LQYHTALGVRSEASTLQSNTLGIELVSGADAKGSWNALISSTAFAYEYVVLSFAVPDLDDTHKDYLVDLGVYDGSANYWVIAADLRLQGTRYTEEMASNVVLPLHIPAGLRVSARTRCDTNGRSIYAMLQGFSSGPMGAPGFSRCIALYSPSSNRGVSVDPGGTVNTRVRTQIISSSSERIAGIFAMIGPDGHTTETNLGMYMMDIETGASSSERILVPNLHLSLGYSCHSRYPQQTHIYPCDVPTGQRFSVNVQCSSSDTTYRCLDVALYGLVP